MEQRLARQEHEACVLTYPLPRPPQLTNDSSAVMSFNQDFWASRVNLPDPRAAFLQESKDDAGALARAKARKVSKEDTVAH